MLGFLECEELAGELLVYAQVDNARRKCSISCEGIQSHKCSNACARI